MIKEIKYTGFTATPSDYECPDGELDAAINFVPEDGELKPVQKGEEEFSVGNNAEKVYIHQNKYKHYIIVYNNNGSLSLAWRDDSDTATITSITGVTFASGEEFVDYASVGNTIIITTNEQFYYLIWRNGSYDFLGNSIPEVKMAFALDGEVVGHTYSATEMEFVTPTGSGTSEEEWTQYETDTFSYQNVPGGAQTSWPYSNWEEREWTLEANKDYRFSNGTDHSNMNFGYIVQAWDGTSYNNGEKVWVDILGHYEDPRGACVSTRRTTSGYVRTPSVTYTWIRVAAYNRRNTTENISFTLEIYKGSESSASFSKVINKTQDNLDALLGKMQLFMKTFATEKERFVYPFFVRYAVRLYDQTYGYISAPILMLPNTGYVPLLNYHAATEQSQQIRAYAFVADLQYAFLSTLSEGWVDIIDGIDIFLSQQIYPYYQDPSLDADYTDTSLFVYKMLQWDTNNTPPTGIDINEIEPINYGDLSLSQGAYISNGYQEKNLYQVIRDQFNFGNYSETRQWNVVQIAPYSLEKIKEKVEGVSNYYLVHSLDLKDIPNSSATTPTAFQTLKIKDGTLYSDSFVNRTTLDENLLTYRIQKTGNLFTYNNRLHSYNATFKLQDPTPLELQNGLHYPSTEYAPDANHPSKVYVYIKTTQGEKIVVEDYCKFGSGSMPWFYYPDRRAYKAQFFEWDTTQVTPSYELVLELPLLPHDKLSGAYWLHKELHEDGSWWTESWDYLTHVDIPVLDDNSDMLTETNIVYVSEAENPFVFDDRLTVQIGCNNIYDLSTATRALSQGQFGQFPLYAFTDNGVWALETSGTGTYVAKQPVTRDVCINRESITQLDNAVLFSTDRGIMLLSGSDSICITDNIFSDSEFKLITPSLTDVVDLLPHLDRLLNARDTSNNLLYPSVTTASGIVPFKKFLPAARMLYDYVHQRIIVYNPDKSYAYIYSLKSKQWGMMDSNIMYGINSYPECLAVDGANKIVNLSAVPEPTAGQAIPSVNGLVITRPLKLEAPDILKTIDTIIQRGQFRKGSVQTILYGSRDLFHWQLVYSSQDHYLRGFSGTPYKYYRIVLLTNMQKDESIFGCTIQFNPRLLDQPR